MQDTLFMALERAAAEGCIALIGEDTSTGLVELRSPSMPHYDPAPRVPVAAWAEAWQVAQLPPHECDLAIRQDLTHVRAGLLALAWRELRDATSHPTDLERHVRFEEAVTVCHQWFLQCMLGPLTGVEQYAILYGQISPEEVEFEARLMLCDHSSSSASGTGEVAS
jgi:hypothetical protein